MIRISNKAILAVIAAGIAMAPATAAETVRTVEADAAQSVAIDVSAINLGSSAGLALLNRKVAFAARQACAAHHDTPDLAMATAERACVTRAIARAQRPIALLTGRSGNQVAMLAR